MLLRHRLLVAATMLLAGCGAAPIGANTSLRHPEQFADARPLAGPVYTFGRGFAWAPARAVLGEDMTPYQARGEWLLTDMGWAYVSPTELALGAPKDGRFDWDEMRGWVWQPAPRFVPGATELSLSLAPPRPLAPHLPGAR
jgi:hypothetical protein